ncbi:MAG: protein translocase subunit SecF [Candidatus Pacebacteria bacterium]|nr:protein translocase subunit SecF [Candidatus Paceibacterota bacterium]
MFNIIEKRAVFLGIAITMLLASFVSMGVFGFKEGIDFSGGTLWQVDFQKDVSIQQFSDILIKNGLEGVSVNKASDGSLIGRTKEISEEKHKEMISIISGELGAFSEMSFQSIGPSVGKELKNKALIAIVLVLFGISLYVAFAFRKISYPVASWKYGVATLVSLFHDVIIPTGVFAWLGSFKGAEVDTNFIVALLVIAGFSVHDTIVVFDRTRENLSKEKGKISFSQIVNKSVNETLARSINTSLTLILVLIALYFAGPSTLQYFVLTILIGTTVGTYSSIFMASPLLVVWYNFTKKEK